MIILAVLTGCGQDTPSAKNSPVLTMTPYEHCYFEPKDDSRASKEDEAFFLQYKRALSEKNLDAILAYTDSAIYNGRTCDSGIDAFRKIWQLDQHSQKSRLWITLRDAVYLGAAERKNGETRTLVFPYTAMFDQQSLPGADFVPVTGKGVNVRQRPGIESPVIAQLNNEFVRSLPQESNDLVWASINGESYPWFKILTPGGLAGYVLGRYYQPVRGFRAVFEKKPRSEWRLVALHAEDEALAAIELGSKQ